MERFYELYRRNWGSEQYVLDALYVQETQALGRELTLGKRRKIRAEYIDALRPAMSPKKRGYKRTAKANEIKDFA